MRSFHFKATSGSLTALVICRQFSRSPLIIERLGALLPQFSNVTDFPFPIQWKSFPLLNKFIPDVQYALFAFPTKMHRKVSIHTNTLTLKTIHTFISQLLNNSVIFIFWCNADQIHTKRATMMEWLVPICLTECHRKVLLCDFMLWRVELTKCWHWINWKLNYSFEGQFRQKNNSYIPMTSKRTVNAKLNFMVYAK